MYISRVQMKGIRGFRELDLRILDEDDNIRMRTAIIGINGTGKTTLLRCIAMGLCGAAHANALLAELPGNIITQGEADAEIKIDLTQAGDSKVLRTIVTKIKSVKNQETVVSQKPTKADFDAPFVVGYGIGVGAEGAGEFRDYRIIDSVFTLFNYSGELTTAELTLRRLRDYLKTKYYDKVHKGIMNALGLPKEAHFDLPPGGGLTVSGPSIGNSIPIGSWADGYRITFSWIIDLYAWAMRADVITQSGGISGVLLIDELEKHLHPSLQTSVLLRLKELWPELQIIGTTHSPLVALGASPEEIVVLRQDGVTVYADDRVPNFIGFSAEDMLRDDGLFNTEVYAPETTKILSEYRELVARNAKELKPRERDRLRDLAKKLRAQQILLSEESAEHSDLQKLRKELGLESSA